MAGRAGRGGARRGEAGRGGGILGARPGFESGTSRVPTHELYNDATTRPANAMAHAGFVIGDVYTEAVCELNDSAYHSCRHRWACPLLVFRTASHYLASRSVPVCMPLIPASPQQPSNDALLSRARVGGGGRGWGGGGGVGGIYIDD